MPRTIWVLCVCAVVVVVAFSAVALQPLHAQRPRISPHERVAARIDGVNVEIVYGRPSMRGRRIFGGLVPYGVVWCPGADEATTLESSRDLEVGSIRVPAGPHTIWILPNLDRWTLIISREPQGFHTQYNARTDLGRVELRKRPLSWSVEQLTFTIEPAPTGGTIAMAWEKTEASVPFRVVP